MIAKWRAIRLFKGMSESEPLYEIRESGIHGRGLFATQDIEKDTWILRYEGEKITKKESLRRALEQDERGKKSGEGQVYIFELNKRYDLDGNFDYNDARLINHSCSPNCEAVDYMGEIWVCATRDIEAGEELSFNYGYDIEFFMDHPCRCGAPNCVGYIVRRDQWSKLKKILRGMKKKRAEAEAEKETTAAR